MSNKTPNEQPKETASEHKSRSYIFISVFVILLFIFLAGLFVSASSGPILTAPAGKISLEIVDSPEKRQLGLSGRVGIENNKGMMFIFDSSSETNCFWMKEMKFPIDMVWLDENKDVINVSENVSPESYPKLYCPTKPAKYGLELQAYRASSLGIEPERHLHF